MLILVLKSIENVRNRIYKAGVATLDPIILLPLRWHVLQLGPSSELDRKRTRHLGSDLLCIVAIPRHVKLVASVTAKGSTAEVATPKVMALVPVVLPLLVVAASALPELLVRSTASMLVAATVVAEVARAGAVLVVEGVTRFRVESVALVVLVLGARVWHVGWTAGSTKITALVCLRTLVKILVARLRHLYC